MAIIFDEKKYAEEILANRNDGRNITQKQLNTLAKYYSYLGYDNMKIRELLIQFGKDKEGSFNEVVNEYRLTNALKATKYPLRVGRKVMLTKKEVGVLLGIQDINVRKVLFVILVVAKYFMRDNFVAYQGGISDLFKLAKLSHLPKQTKQSIIHTLGTLGLIKADLKFGFYHILFFDPEDKSVEITIDGFSDIMNFFPVVCQNCGKLMLGKPKRRMICDECYRKKIRDDGRKRIKQFREKINVTR